MLVSGILSVFLVFLLVLISPVVIYAQECTIEGETKPCGSNVGACQGGTQNCHSGKWTECAGGVEPILEICDNEVDDDCDGLVDECLKSIWSVLIIAGILLLILLVMLMKFGF